MIPDDILKKHFFKCLQPNELTALGMTCRPLNDCVRSFREPMDTPYILREEQLLTRMAYDTEMATDGEFDARVHQIHPFRFLLATEQHGIVQIDVKLGKKVYREYHIGDIMKKHAVGGTLPFSSRGHFSKTWVGVKVHRRIRFGNATTRTLKLFPREQYDVPEAPGYRYHDDGLVEGLDLGLQRNQQDLRDILVYVMKCAERIADFPDPRSYPSMEYIMGNLPEEFRRFFPRCLVGLDWSSFPDQTTPLEWTHRPAGSPAEWNAQILPWLGKDDQTREYWHEYEIDELSWYRSYYPKLSVDSNNLLGTLPKTIVERSIAPFMSADDLASLGMTCKSWNTSVSQLVSDARFVKPVLVPDRFKKIRLHFSKETRSEHGAAIFIVMSSDEKSRLRRMLTKLISYSVELKWDILSTIRKIEVCFGEDCLKEVRMDLDSPDDDRVAFL